MRQKPVMLLILDGWGYRRPITPDNAIEAGETPNWHKYVEEYPHSLIETSGLAVGLPEGQMGNSEVGHTNLGAGRVVMQDLPRIDMAIKDGSMEKNPVLVEVIEKLKASGKTCHITGLMSPGGVHSTQKHIAAVCNILDKNGVKVNVHVITDGRDTPPESGKGYIAEFKKDVETCKNLKIVTLEGRYYAMDRDKRWDRIEKAYNTIVCAEGEVFATIEEAFDATYGKSVTDEFVVPCVIGDYKGMEDGDAFIMVNYRWDRAREITSALADPKFDGFLRKKVVEFSDAVGMTEYSKNHRRFLKIMYPPQELTHIFGEVIAENGLTQLRIAETEKYAHVTFFFNGGEEKLFEGEDRILVDSPKDVATYDLKPEMSLPEVTDKLIDAIKSGKYDTIICNFANGDMVGHTGVMEAALKAVKAVDESLKRTVEAIVEVGGVLIVAADHGNIEEMVDPINGGPYTAHTVGSVRAVLINDKSGVVGLKDGRLADIAPTMLGLMGIEQPSEMTGQSLLIRK